MENTNNLPTSINNNSSALNSNPPYVWVLGTLGIVGIGIIIYQLGKKVGRKETKKEYKSRVQAILDRADIVLAEKQAQY